MSPSPIVSPGLNASPSLNMSPGLIATPCLDAPPGLNTSPSLNMSPSLDVPPGLDTSPNLTISPSPDVSPGLAASPYQQYLNTDWMNMGPIPAVTSPALGSPLSDSNMALETTPSQSYDLDLTIDDPGIGLSSSRSSPLDPTLSPRNGRQQPPPDPFAIQAESNTVLGQPPIAPAVEGAFDRDGVHGDFITAVTIKYWESILGGEKWIKMVQSYLNLKRMPLNTVRDPPTTLNRY